MVRCIRVHAVFARVVRCFLGVRYTGVGSSIQGWGLCLTVVSELVLNVVTEKSESDAEFKFKFKKPTASSVCGWSEDRGRRCFRVQPLVQPYAALFKTDAA